VKRVLRSRGDAESDEVALVAIFDGVDLKSRASAFRGGSMFAWFGGISVDLREAKLSSDGAHLDLHALNGLRSRCQRAGAFGPTCGPSLEALPRAFRSPRQRTRRR
jgi:hypothetical protein